MRGRKAMAWLCSSGNDDRYAAVEGPQASVDDRPGFGELGVGGRHFATPSFRPAPARAVPSQGGLPGYLSSTRIAW